MEKNDDKKIVIYERRDGTPYEIQLKDNTVWLTQQQIANIFVVKKAAISKHIAHIYREGELERKLTVSKMETVQREGGRMVSRMVEYYNLDMIISVGYRVNSRHATQFRIWATKVLRDHIMNGITLNERRLKHAYQLQIKELQRTVKLLQGTLEKRTTT